MKKIFKKLLVASVAAGAFLFNSPLDSFNFVPTAHAEVKIYIGVGKGTQSELVTAAQAKNYAKLRAELNAKDQAGVYVSGYYRAKNFTITENEVSVITNSIISIVGEVQYTQKAFNLDGVPAVVYTATLQANIDSDGIAAYIQRQNEKGGTKSQIQSADKEIKEKLDKIDSLNERYNKATTKAEKEKIRAEFSQADRNVLAVQKLDEGNEFFYNGEYEKAIELYSESLAFNPNYAYAYNNRGIAYSDLKQCEKAIVDYNKAIQINPNLYQSYNNRGLAHSDLKQYEAAIADFNKAIELNSDLYQAYYNRGIAYSGLKQYNRAILDYNKAIELNPNDSEIYNNRGNAYGNLKQYEKAIENYSTAIQLNPNLYQSYNNRGNVYARDLKQYEAAILDYNKAIELNPNDSEIYYNRGNAYGNLKQYEKAIENYTFAIQLNLNYTDAYFNRGIAYALKGNFQQAINDVTEIIDIDPNNAALYQLRGLCYQELGETEKANADFAKARELGYKG